MPKLPSCLQSEPTNEHDHVGDAFARPEFCCFDAEAML